MATQWVVPAAKVTLSARQWLALESLLDQGNVTRAAESAGVTRKTLHAWTKLPAFASEYRDARRRQVAAAGASLQRYAGVAAATLVTLMADRNVSPAVRLAAAKTVLELSIRAIEVEDIAARLDALEQGQAVAR